MTEFGKSIAAMLLGMDIKLIHSEPYKPSTQGAIERFNGTLKRALFKLMAEHGTKNWVKLLHEWITGYNNSTHSTTGWKPNELLKAKLTRQQQEELQAKLKGRAREPTHVDEQDFNVGDVVRVALTVYPGERRLESSGFRKSFRQNWSTTTFRILTKSAPTDGNSKPQYTVMNLETNRKWSKQLWGYQLQLVKRQPIKTERKIEAKVPSEPAPVLDEPEG